MAGPQDAGDRGDFVGYRVGPGAPRVQQLGASLDREEQHSGVQLLGGDERHLQCGDDAHAAAAAADGPEQVRLVAAVSAREAAVHGDEFDGGHAVGREPVAARQPADPAAERIARHAHVRRGARERGEAVLGGGDGHVLPFGARLGAGDAGRRMDVDAPHARRLEQHRAVQRLQRHGAVAGAPRSDAHPLRAGELHRSDHIGGRLGEHDSRRPLVRSE